MCSQSRSSTSSLANSNKYQSRLALDTIAIPGQPPSTDGDTIVAVATPPGQGGIGIVRLSGSLAAQIIAAISGVTPKPRFATLASFKQADGELIDQGLVLYFPAPASYTGEDVAELQGHGSPMIMQMLLRRCLQLGARMARPGEFSERAFVNGRLDLAQAEAVADLIASHTEAAARSAVRSLKGEFSNRIEGLVAVLTGLRIEVEAAIDFPEDDIDCIAHDKILTRCAQLQHNFDRLAHTTRQGQLLRDGLKVVLTGPPNAGKSSLLNALSRVDRAIVSPQAGTTRDVLQQQIQIDGLPLEIIDTAGIRDTDDELEAEGVRRTRLAQSEADLVLLLVDDSCTSEQRSDALLSQFDSLVPVWLVRNKIDLSGRHAGVVNKQIAISATTGQGLELLRQALVRQVGFRGQEDCCFSARQRHLDALRRAQRHLDNGIEQSKQYQSIELLAEELRCAQSALAEITGEVSSDDLLGLIFGSFCVGK